MILKATVIFSACMVLVSSSPRRCGRNEVWAEWRDSCPPTCEFRNPPCIIETTQPPPGCTCKPGYIYLNSVERICVKISECPKTCSEPIFFWNDCGSRCPLTCFNQEPRYCEEVCQPGCFCPRRYILDDITNQCVRRSNCTIF
ncbi:hypothetical protein WA026_017939 [Henosepilachna vigintioctopunctata]|uniref:TIL domain-containing protein n=1 Tax=Henosepilachna vigintioctopunctata TaxID=420089 RepID=A0AAW1TQ61_9CUCU